MMAIFMVVNLEQETGLGLLDQLVESVEMDLVELNDVEETVDAFADHPE